MTKSRHYKLLVFIGGYSMFLVLSGEGPTDIGQNGTEIGPMSKLVDIWIQRRSGNSLLGSGYYCVLTKNDLSKRAKSIKPKSRAGKKKKETRYFYNNARALAQLATELGTTHAVEPIAVLFRDSDGTASSHRGLWEEKMNSVLNGFEAEEFSNGVPMIPRPKSEAWLLCALQNHYQNCGALENLPGNDASPNSAKTRLEGHLGERATRVLINTMVDDGRIDINRINDMPSLAAF